MKFQIALRNVLRNRRRTVLNVTMIAAGITAIVIFKGFAHNLLGKLQWVAINTQFGHVQLASSKTWNLSAKDKPKDRLIHLDDSLQKKINSMGGVEYSSGRLTFFGMVNNGTEALSARGVGFDPAVEVQMLKSMFMVEGRNLNRNSKYEIILGKGLRDQIGMAVGNNVTLMAYTFDGSVNAVDCELVGIFQSGLAEIDNSTFFLPLATAQTLLDTDSVERWVIQLHNTEDTEKIRSGLPALPEGLSSKSWEELAAYYRQVVDYFGVQNLIIQWILFLLALLAIGNIVGTSIAERTGEIGTMRAMGNSRNAVITLFLFEGLILGAFGGISGCIFGFLAAKLVNLLKVPIITPGASLPLPIEVDILPGAFGSAFVVMCLMALAATLLPAYRAANFEIVEALKRNI